MADSAQRALFDRMPFVVYECMAVPPYADLYVSAHMQRQFGWAPAQFYADPEFWRNIIHPDDRERVDQAMAEIVSRGHQRFEYRVRHADGRWLWCRDDARCEGRGDSARIIGCWEDIDREFQQRQRAERRGRLLALIGQLQSAFIAGQPLNAQWDALLDQLIALGALHSAALLAWPEPGAEHWQPWRVRVARPGDAPPRDWPGAAGDRAQALARLQHCDTDEVDSAPSLRWVLPLGALAESQAVLLLQGSASGSAQEGLPSELQPLLDTLHQLLLAERQQQAQQAAQRERDRLAELLGKLDSAVLIADRDGCIDWINSGFTRLTGYTLEEARGRRPDHLLTAADTPAAALQQLADRIAAGVVHEGEIHNRRKDGSTYWARLRIEPTVDAAGQASGYVAMQSDVSSEVAEREARMALADRLQKLASAVPGMIYQFQRDADGRARFPWSSDGIRQIYQLSPEAVREDASPVFARLHPDDLPRVSASILASAEQLVPWQCEYRLRPANGDERWLFGQAMPERLADGGTLWHGHITEISALKQAEQAERQARAQLQSLIDAAVETSIIATELDGTIRVFNRGAERLLGYQGEQLIGRTSPALFHDPEEVAERAAELSATLGRRIEGFETFVWAAREGRTEQRIWTYIRSDGQRRQVSLTVAGIIDNYGGLSGFLGIATDRTAQWQAEQALRRSEAKFRQLYESANVAIMRCRLADGRILEGNQALCEISGFRAAELSSVDDLSLLDGSALDGYRQQTQRLAEHGRCGPFVSQLRRPDGQRVDVLISRILDPDDATPITSWSIIQDITHYKRSEALALASTRALADLVERTRIILDHSADGILSLDQQGLIESINPAAEQLFAVRADQVIGRRANEVFSLFGADGQQAPLALQQPTEALPIECALQRGDGQRLEVELSVTAAARREGTLFVVVIRDISERKRVEQMKSQFIATVSHELRTPLTSVRGAVGLIAGGSLGPLPETAGRLLSVANRNIERLTQLIDDLLDMEKLLAGELRVIGRDCALQPLLEQAIELHRELAAAQGVALCLLGDAACSVQLDPQRWLQVLGNLISNAVKFSPPGSTVELAVQLLPERVRIEVRDHGPGVPASFQSRLFQKFSQADSSDTRAVGGTGLGLAICRGLVEQMGGTISYRDGAPGGAVFVCEFPRTDPVAADTPSMQLVESDSALAASLLQVLSAAGFAAQPADPADSEPCPGRCTVLAIENRPGRRDDLRRLRPWWRRAQAGAGPLLLLPLASDEIDRLQDPGWSAAEWQPEALTAEALAALVRNLLGEISDQRARLLHLTADPRRHASLPRLARAWARWQFCERAEAVERQLREGALDLLLIEHPLAGGSGWQVLPPLCRLPRLPPLLLLGSANPVLP